MPQAVAYASAQLAGYLYAAGISAQASVLISGLVINVTGSLLVSAAYNALMGSQMQTAADTARELAAPTNLPVYRYVYGETRAVGTPAGTPVRGDYIYGCWILNSRPSALSSFTLYLDKRQVTLTGDAFNFSGSGATATNDPFSGHLNVWISRGDKTTPPSVFTTEAPFASGEDGELWKTTDGWQGRTVIWMRLKAGDNDERQERWPSAPPTVEVEGQWSKVYDMRDAGQDPDDPDTWEYSDNWALCIRDALSQNPFKPYQNKSLADDLFEVAADASDENQALNVGGFEKRYRIAGTLLFNNSEIEDQISPMVASGAGSLIRVGGKLGILPGKYQTPDTVVEDLWGNDFQAVDLRSGNEMVNELRVSYISPDRGYEMAELEPWTIPGALAEDGGLPSTENLRLSFCPSATQAGRVRKILGGLMRRQKSLDVVLPPKAFNCVVGSTITLTLTGPLSHFNGVYEIVRMQPGFSIDDQSGQVQMIIPATLVKHSEDIYDWDPATDEEDIVVEDYYGDRDGVQPPVTDSYSMYYYNTGSNYQPRIKWLFTPSTSSDVDYVVEYRENDGDWQPWTDIDGSLRDSVATTKCYGVIHSFSDFVSIDIRYKAKSPAGASDWVYINNIDTNSSVSGGSASAGLGAATFAGTSPTSPNFSYFKVYRGASTSFGSAVALTGTYAFAPNTAFNFTAGDATRTNQVVNGTFTGSAASWTLSAGWTYGSNAVAHSGAQSDLIQSLTLTGTLRCSTMISGRTTGTAQFIAVGTANSSITATSANGQYVGSMAAPASMTQIRARGSTGFDGTVDDVVVFEETASCLTQGQAYYWVVPFTSTGVQGTPAGPYNLTII